jgi:hypothetical protein
MTRPTFDELDAPPDPSGSDEMLVFFDTEFSSMLSPQLLSIGLVAESGTELYIEVAGAQELVVSDFVRHEVLPLLGLHTPLVLEYDAIALQLEAWFDGLRGGDRRIGIVLVSDYPVDWMLVTELKVLMPGEQSWTRAANIGGRMVQNLMASGRQVAQYFEAIEDFHRIHGQRHHALVDARAVKYAISEMRFE